MGGRKDARETKKRSPGEKGRKRKRSSSHRHGVLQALPEVVHCQRQAHRQHQEAERVGEQIRLEPGERCGLGDPQGGAGADPDGEERGERLSDVLERGALAGDGEVARGLRGDDGAGEESGEGEGEGEEEAEEVVGVEVSGDRRSDDPTSCLQFAPARPPGCRSNALAAQKT